MTGNGEAQIGGKPMRCSAKSGFTAEMKRIAKEDHVLLFHQERQIAP